MSPESLVKAWLEVIDGEVPEEVKNELVAASWGQDDAVEFTPT
jgi:hypothetical protein